MQRRGLTALSRGSGRSSSGPLLGNVESGLVAVAFSARVSVISGGVLCVAGVAPCALLLPGFRRHDASAPGG